MHQITKQSANRKGNTYTSHMKLDLGYPGTVRPGIFCMMFLGLRPDICQCRNYGTQILCTDLRSDTCRYHNLCRTQVVRASQHRSQECGSNTVNVYHKLCDATHQPYRIGNWQQNPYHSYAGKRWGFRHRNSIPSRSSCMFHQTELHN